ncbi:hypothetical protein B0H16DRAFT_1615505, partial [Mycena metata]
MLQSLLNIFFPHKREKTPSADPEFLKMSPFVTSLHPRKYINGVLETKVLTHSTTSWLKTLVSVGDDERRIEDLDRCIVDAVHHFRSSKMVHESAGFTFHLAPENLADVSARVRTEDYRAAQVHRIPAVGTPDKRPVQTRAMDSFQLSADCLKMGDKTATNDMLKIDGNYNELKLTPAHNCYKMLQGFNVLLGTPLSERLTVLDCAILASVITQWASDYSRLNHMCLWFATVFFLAARRICAERGYPPISMETPDLARLGGKWRNVSLIDPRTGRLLFNKLNPTDIHKIKKYMKRGMSRSAVDDEETEKFLQQLDTDIARLAQDEKTTGTDALDTILVLFNTRRMQVRERMHADIRVAWEKKTAFERRTVAAEQRAQE